VWIRIAALLLCAATTAASHARLPSENPATRSELFLPRPEVARATALGFEAVLADYYWLQAVQIVGGSSNPAQHASLLGRLVDVVTTLDPWVDHPYRFAAFWLTQSPEQVRLANRLLRRGIEHHPDEWRNRYHLGFNHFFYLGEDAEAADALEAAAGLPGAPAYLHRLAARLRSGTEGLEAAATLLHELVRTTDDPYARAEYEKALDEIETERRARFLDAAREAYRARFGRDIERVEELAAVAVIPAELHGWEWVLDDQGRIVSSWYDGRYELRMHESDLARRERWAAEPSR
jgi:hypothetical protein